MKTSNTKNSNKAMRYGGALLLGTLLVSAFTGCSTLSGQNKNQSTTGSNTVSQTTVSNVDLDKYQGTWYEIARLPMYFQRNCASDVTATYKKQADGSVEVINKCMDKDGEMMVSNGVATVDDRYPEANNSKLLVTFLPKSLRWLPVGNGGYWILALDEEKDANGEVQNYTHSLVGSPSRKYLWILSRTPNMSDADYQRYVDIAKSQGYDLSEFTRTKHTQ